jgi:hypothetical protein
MGSVLAEVDQLLDDGADGIFVDEATTVSNDWELWYHYQIFEAVKDYDEENLVIINPGTTALSEDAMLVADIICFEHEWRGIENVDWMSRYPGWRYMGISSNEFVNVMGYHVDGKSARADLEEARSLNIAYHYSADHYIWLPPWFDVYGGQAGSPHPVSSFVPLDLGEPQRPEGYYPVVDTETDKVGNDYDVVIVEEKPKDPAANNNTSTEPINETESNGQPSQPEPSEEDTEMEEPNDNNNATDNDANDTATNPFNVTHADNSTQSSQTITDQRADLTGVMTNNGTSIGAREQENSPPPTNTTASEPQ